MRQRSTKTAKYKISYRECLAVFNNEQMSTLQGDLYMVPDQTKTNASTKKMHINTRPRNWKALFQTKNIQQKGIHVERQIFILFFKIILQWSNGFLDIKGAWPKILIKCVRVGQKIRVGRETLNRHFFLA